ncbi:Monocarboxylate transporter 12 [Armadillidium vulgare]|nr:Monocarboxylate transporter 12 [Armadillidium vulgare]
MTGIGACLIESVQVVTLTHYFEEKLSMANGLRVSGNPIGSIIYPIILLLLGNEFGFRALRLILGSIFLHILICALLTRSPEIHRKIQILNHVRASEVNGCEKTELYKTLNNNIPTPTKKSERKPFEFHYFMNYVYWIFILSSIAITFALPTIGFYIPIYGKSFGLSAEEISLLLSSQSLIDTILRAIIDASDSFVVAFIVMGGGLFFSAILLLLEPFVIKITNSTVVIT